MFGGVVAFVVALGAAILITKYYTLPPPPPPAAPPAAPAEAPAPPTNPPPAPDAPQVSFKPQMITLDLAARQSHTTLTVERDPARPAPSRLWVRTYFFSTEAVGKVWVGEPVEIKEPLAGARRATVTATAACPWCSDRSAPRGGYYARVVVSADSKGAARVDDAKVDTNISTAEPVVVQEAAKGQR